MVKLELVRGGYLFTVLNGNVILPDEEDFTEYTEMLDLPYRYFLDKFDFLGDLAKRLGYESYDEMLLAFRELPDGVYSVMLKK